MKVASSLFKIAMLSTISAGSLTISSAAIAQDVSADAAAKAAEMAAKVAAEEEPNYDENEILVTATKREQTLQEIPVAVTVTTAEAIEKAQVRDLIDLQTIAPTLRVNQLQSSANTNFSIRGFGNGANNAGIEPSVGVFIDGVYRSRSAAQIGDLPNLKRVEVLRGPQSTLFGKNASAGVISIVTAAPQYQFGGSAEASYGNFNAIIVKGDVTGPITDKIAFSIAGNINKRDGYAQDLRLNNDANTRDRWGTRGQLLIQPNDDSTIRLIADYDKIDERCCVAGNVFNGPTGFLVNNLAGGTGLDANNPFSYRVYNNIASDNKIKNYGGSGQIDHDFGEFGVTSITAYRGVNSFSNQDSDFTAAVLLDRNINDTKIRTFTQELRLTSNTDGPVNFLVGAYFFNEKIKVNNEIKFGSDFRNYGDALVRLATGGTPGAVSPTAPAGVSGGALNFAALEAALGGSDFLAGRVAAPNAYAGRFFANNTGYDEAFTLKDNSISVFGSMDFELTERLTVTGGMNYTKDKKRFSSNVLATETFSSLDLDAPQYAAFRNQLIFGGGLAQQVGTILALGRSATQAEIGAFSVANPGAFAQVSAGVQAFANANQNNPAANPLNGLKAFQFQPPLINYPNAVENGRTRDSDFSYSIRAAYKATDNLNLYASYATGFKASSVNLSRDSRPALIDRNALIAAGLTQPNQTYGSRFASPEKAAVYELGIKGKFDQFAFNLTLFEQSISGFQSNVFTGTGFALANAGKQTTKGLEFDSTFSPIDNLTLSGAVVYLDPKYDSFRNSSTGDISGTRPSGIPKWSTTVGFDYDLPIGNNSLNFHADYHYESKVDLFDVNRTNPAALNFQRTVHDLSASATFTLGEKLRLSIWGRNLTDSNYLTTVFPSVGQNGSFSGYPSQPRTYGVAAKYKF
jgi:iron complex outermembrane recepter protein